MVLRAVLIISCIIWLSIQDATSYLEAKSACTSDYVKGTCICKLEDGSGTIDLTRYANLTEQTPLTGEDPLETWMYDFTFCGVLTNQPNLTFCYQQASVCKYAKWSPNLNDLIGDPKTTRFEMRKSANHTTPTLALVTETTAASSKLRSVAFLICDPSLKSVPQFIPEPFTGDKDEDDFQLYYFEIRGADLCLGGQSAEGLSTGSILLIIFFSLLFAYFVGGFLWLTFVSKREGSERIPQKWFWADLPFMILDGFMFSYRSLRRCCCGGGAGHQ